MNLLKRLKNLWNLSEYQPMEINQVLKGGDTIAPLYRPSEKAQIIKKYVDPIDELLNK